MSDDPSPPNESKVFELNTAGLAELREKHRHLDERINELTQSPFVDRLLLQRLKKQKLAYKDAIERLRSQLIPDIDA